MLRLLRIRNFALIKELEIEFESGLNLLTGETGSGKSILVDAFGMLLGERAALEMIRSGCETAIVEGMFDIGTGKTVSRLLEDAGFDSEDNVLLVRREISSVGKNRVFINGHLATLNLLKTLGENLADIHGQQDQRSLLDLPTNLKWLDFFGNNAPLVAEVRKRFTKLRDTARRLENFEAEKKERNHRMEILRFQLDEIQRVNPVPNEREALEKENAILSNGEKILSYATDAYAALYESESSILTGIRDLQRLLLELEHFDSNWGPNRESLEECVYRLEDIALAARDYAARCDFSPERLDQVQQRLFSLEKLTKKYCPSGIDILEYAEDCARELESLTKSEDTASDLQNRLQSEAGQYMEAAGELSAKRRGDALKLEKTILAEFSVLAMPKMKLHVKFQEPEDEEGGGLVPGYYGLDGIDQVEFLIAPNEGEAMRPLARIASGGELSRLMLAIKSLCGKEDSGKTLVFDEVDAGIGGRVAEAVGKRLESLSRHNQVLCVTHLPQIAAFARTHYSVRKAVSEGRTETVAELLDGPERIREISRMLGGEVITDAARRHAQEMLERSSVNKESDGNAVE